MKLKCYYIILLIKQSQGASPDDAEKLFKVGPTVQSNQWKRLLKTHVGESCTPVNSKKLIVIIRQAPSSAVASGTCTPS